MKLNQSIRKDRIVELAEQYDAVLLAAGANKPRSLELEGLPEGGQSRDCEFMQRFNDGRPERIEGDVLVVGGGFTAVDPRVVAAALRIEGERDDRVRRGERKWRPRTRNFAAMREERIGIETLAAPVAAKCENGRKSGRFPAEYLGKTLEGAKPAFTPVAGGDFEMPRDTLIFAIGQERETEILPKEIRIGNDDQTNVANLFVGGNFLGAHSADVIRRRRRRQTRGRQNRRLSDGRESPKKYLDVKPAEITGRLRDHDLVDPPEMPMLPLGERGSLDEVELVSTPKRPTSTPGAAICAITSSRSSGQVHPLRLVHQGLAAQLHFAAGRTLRDEDGAARHGAKFPPIGPTRHVHLDRRRPVHPSRQLH